MTPDEFLDWLCWSTALDGERFFPPRETAGECMDGVGHVYEDNDDMVWEEGLAWEVGQHARAWSDAVELFVSMQRRGFDPVERAERYITRAHRDGQDLSDIGWSWLEASRYEFDDEP